MLLKQLFETIETRDSQTVWDEVADGAASYSPSQVFLVRPSESKKGQFDVYTDKQNKRTLYSTMTSDDLRDTLEQIRSTDKPDAEGFTMYKSRETLDAVQYNGDPVNITDGTSTSRLKKGDFLVRTTEGDNFVYAVEPESFFADAYVKV